MNATHVNTTGWGDSLREKLTVWVGSFREQPSEVIVNGLLFMALGLLSGFLCRKYSSYVFVVVMTFVGIGILQHLELFNVLVNWHKVYEVFGFHFAGVSGGDVFSRLWECWKEFV